MYIFKYPPNKNILLFIDTVDLKNLSLEDFGARITFKNKNKSIFIKHNIAHTLSRLRKVP